MKSPPCIISTDGDNAIEKENLGVVNQTFIKKRMTQLKLSVSQLAEKAGLPYSTVANVVKGVTQDPNLSTCIALSLGLKVGIMRLVETSRNK